MDCINKDVLERILHFAAVLSPQFPNGDGGALTCCRLEAVCTNLCSLGNQVSWQRIVRARWEDVKASYGDALRWRSWYKQRHVFESRVHKSLMIAGIEHIDTTMHQSDHFKDVIVASIAHNDCKDVNCKPTSHVHGITFLTSLVNSNTNFTISFYANEALRYLRQETMKTRLTEIFSLPSDHQHCEEIALMYQGWIMDCSVDLTQLNSQLDTLADAIKTTFDAKDDDLEKLTKFCNYMREYGCTGNVNDYYNQNNSFIGIVLHQRQGNPITLAVIYIATARRVGLDMSPINFPSHFLVKLVPHDKNHKHSISTNPTIYATTTTNPDNNNTNTLNAANNNKNNNTNHNDTSCNTNTTSTADNNNNNNTVDDHANNSSNYDNLKNNTNNNNNNKNHNNKLVRFVDPFEGGAVYTRAEVLAKFSNIIGRASQSQLNHVLDSCKMKDVLMRMCRNTYLIGEDTGYASRTFFNAIDLATFLDPQGIDFRMARVERAVNELEFSEPFFSLCEQDLIHVISNSSRHPQILRKATALLGHIKDSQHCLRNKAPVIKRRGAPWTLAPGAPYCGAICQSDSGHVCIVTGWHHTCPVSASWQALQPVHRLKHGAEQPFFNILSEQEGVRCVALESLELLSGTRIRAWSDNSDSTDHDDDDNMNNNHNNDVNIINHNKRRTYEYYLAPSAPGLTENNLGRYFESFSESRDRYLLNPGLLQTYPDDNEC